MKNNKGYDSPVGERGVQLSGDTSKDCHSKGSYKDLNFNFDEATSALDSLTENSLIDSLQAYQIPLTIIIVSHRSETLKNCTKIISI